MLHDVIKPYTQICVDNRQLFRVTGHIPLTALSWLLCIKNHCMFSIKCWRLFKSYTQSCVYEIQLPRVTRHIPPSQLYYGYWPGRTCPVNEQSNSLQCNAFYGVHFSFLCSSRCMCVYVGGGMTTIVMLPPVPSCFNSTFKHFFTCSSTQVVFLCQSVCEFWVAFPTAVQYRVEVGEVYSVELRLERCIADEYNWGGGGV